MAAKSCGTSPVYASLDAIFSGTSFSFFSCIEVKNTTVLYAEEEVLLKKQGVKRLIDFCKGRYCAHRALEKMGYHSSPILRDANGAPIWPEEIIGSISHSGDIATAVVALNAGILGIGLDIQNKSLAFPSKVISILFHNDEVVQFLNVPYPSNPAIYSHSFINASIASGANGSNSSIRLLG
ncbi:MAG: hypothetical protein ABL861_01310, partial [Nitrosomonas sp.]